MTTSDERIAKLEAHIDKLETEQRKLRSGSQIGSEGPHPVSVHAGSLEPGPPGPAAGRPAQPVARREIGHSKDTASDVIDTLRESVEAAIKALRDAVLDTRKDAAD
jgi:hypothetical protein